MDKAQMLREIKERYNFRTDADFARFLGITPQNLKHWLTRSTYDINILAAKFEDLNLHWLLTGDGEMKKNVQHIGSVGGNNHKIIGQVNGDFNEGTGKDKVIELQGGQVKDILTLLYEELGKFHEKLERKDNYIMEVVKDSFERNESNMKRIDQLIGIIVAQNEITIKQDEKIQDRADKLMDILKEKL